MQDLTDMDQAKAYLQQQLPRIRAVAEAVLVEMGVILHLLQALVLVLSAKSLLLLAQRFIMQQVVVAVFVREMLWH